MKQKYIFSLLPALFVSIMLLTSCSKDYVSPLSGKTISDLTFGPELSYQTVNFDGQDMSNITATSSEGWCQAYAKDNELLVNVIDNYTYSDRTATIDVVDQQTKDHLTFKVTQKQNDAVIADPVTYSAPSDGGIVTVTLQKNVENCEVLPEVDWITAKSRSYTRGLTDATIELVVAKNESEKDREGQVKIKSANSEAYSLITIRQLFAYSLKLESDIAVVGENGGEIEMTVYANFDYRAEISPTYKWIQSGTRTKAEPGKYVHKFTVSALPSDMDSRRGLVYFVNSDLSYSRLLTIEQKRE